MAPRPAHPIQPTGVKYPGRPRYSGVSKTSSLAGGVPVRILIASAIWGVAAFRRLAKKRWEAANPTGTRLQRFLNAQAGGVRGSRPSFATWEGWAESAIRHLRRASKIDSARKTDERGGTRGAVKLAGNMRRIWSFSDFRAALSVFSSARPRWFRIFSYRFRVRRWVLMTDPSERCQGPRRTPQTTNEQ